VRKQIHDEEQAGKSSLVKEKEEKEVGKRQHHKKLLG
jgi:hypothetical protein